MAVEARDDGLAGQFVFGHQSGEGSIGSVNIERSVFGVDHPNQPNASSKVFFDLLVQVINGVVRRDDFDSKIRRDGDVSASELLGRKSASRNEGHIRATDFERIVLVILKALEAAIRAGDGADRMFLQEQPQLK